MVAKLHQSSQQQKTSSGEFSEGRPTTNYPARRQLPARDEVAGGQLPTTDYTLYVITANVPKLNRTHVDVAKGAVAGGATTIQFREKTGSNRKFLQMVYKLRELAKKKGVPLIINDRVDIAMAMQADGVHLGQTDMPFFLARKIMGYTKIVGCSATNLEEALGADKMGADYLGVGPVFPTPSKEDAASPIGLKGLAEIKKRVEIPVVAIGGITLDNVDEVVKAGVDGIAVISAVAQAPDIKKATQKLLAKIQVTKEEIKK